MTAARSPRSPLDDPALRRVNFRDDDYSYNNALHPQPIRNYSNPAAHKLVNDPNDFLRRVGPNIQEQQFDEQRKGSKLVKRQKSGNERTLRKRFFAGFRSKKSSAQKVPQVEEKISKSGVKYMEIMSHDGAVPSDPRDLNDSAWTTAFTTARPSIDLDDPIAEEDVPQYPPEGQTLQVNASPAPAPASSSYSPRLSNDQLHQLITDIGGPSETSTLPTHISQVYRARTTDGTPVSTAQIALQNTETLRSHKASHRESLRYSKSNEELFSLPKLTLNAELEALKMLRRYPTPDLVGASGATDPSLALSSHPTAPPARPPPSIPSDDLRSAWSNQDPHARPEDTMQPNSQRGLPRSATDPVTSTGTSTVDQASTRREERKSRILLLKSSPSMSNESNTSPLAAEMSPASTRNAVPFYFSESEPESMVTEPSNPRNRKFARATVQSVDSSKEASHGTSASTSDAIDPSLGLLINSNANFLESPRQSLQTERAAQRVNKVRERKLRDKKSSAGHTPPMHSSGPSSEDVATRPPPAAVRYPKDAPTRKSSPISTGAPPMPAVPSPSKIADHLSRTNSSRAGSMHSNDAGVPVTKKSRDRTPPPKRSTPLPPPLPMTDSPTDYHTPTSAGNEQLSASRIMLVAETSPKSSTGRPAQAYLAPGGGAPPSQRLSKRNSGLDARARIAELERKNQLLEAALAAVLATAGRLNGCPCQGQGQNPMSTGAPDALELYRATRASSRLSMHSGVGPPA